MRSRCGAPRAGRGGAGVSVLSERRGALEKERETGASTARGVIAGTCGDTLTFDDSLTLVPDTY